MSAKRNSAEENRLRITEIFYSIQGEANSSGWPTVFIRLTGCPLRCGYCDTAHAFSGGEWKTIEAILHQVTHYQTEYVCVTGGEPLAQKGVHQLLSALCDGGYKVSLETSGALPIENVDTRVEVVMDLKTPSSGEQNQNCYDNIKRLKPGDQVKFVICDREDYEWSKATVDRYRLRHKCQVLFSSAYQEVSPVQLAEWIIADQLEVRFQLQLHKVLWGNEQGR